MRSQIAWCRDLIPDLVGPLLVALAATVCVIATLDVHPRPVTFAGPGLTLDEPFNIAQGIALADRFLALDIAGYSRVCATLPDHPPLGRLWIGLHHHLLVACGWPTNSGNWSLNAARIGSATAFGLTILLIGTVAGRWWGRRAGVYASVALALMPRLFGHAHVAALETSMNLTYAAAALAVANTLARPTPPTIRQAAFAGILMGLALLTKIQGILLTPLIVLWLIGHWRVRSLLPLAIWADVTALVFFVGWPWLWDAPFEHVSAYLGRTTNRSVVQAWYFDHQYVDRDLPWHYAPLMFVVTVPLGFQLLGAAGAVTAIRGKPLNDAGPSEAAGASRPTRERSRDLYLLGAIFFPVFVFSLPGVAVYDGERLFSVSFPLWAMLVGRGASWFGSLLKGRVNRPIEFAALPLVVALQTIGIVTTSPCQLSYYNIAVGGLRGAEVCGLPVTYWGDSQTATFLSEAAQELPTGSVVQILPVMHAFQIPALEQSWPGVRERQLRLVPFNTVRGRYVLFINRREYLPVEYGKRPPPGRLLVTLKRQGVLLAGLVELEQPSSPSGSK